MSACDSYDCSFAFASPRPSSSSSPIVSSATLGNAERVRGRGVILFVVKPVRVAVTIEMIMNSIAWARPGACGGINTRIGRSEQYMYSAHWWTTSLR